MRHTLRRLRRWRPRDAAQHGGEHLGYVDDFGHGRRMGQMTPKRKD